jgi:hypothetical protein
MDGKFIAFWLQSISDMSAVGPLVAFYETRGREGEALFFSSVPDTTREFSIITS